MATDGGSPEQVKAEIRREREQLAGAVEALRVELQEATDLGSKLRPKLPLLAAGALGAGFVVSGGIGATVRLFLRRGREGTTKAAVGRYRVVEK